MKKSSSGLQGFIALEHFRSTVNTALEHLHIRENQLKVDRLNVPQRVDAALDMDDVVVLETAYHVDDRVHLTDVGQEFVAETFAFARALHQASNVDEFDHRRGHLDRIVQLRELVEPLVRHAHDPDVRIDGAERIIGALRSCVGDGVEQGGLADVRQPTIPSFTVDSSFHRGALPLHPAAFEKAGETFDHGQNAVAFCP